MAGGGTGGHVIPAIAVARSLKAQGHRVVFVGTKKGMEGRLLPPTGFETEWIEIGGLNRVSLGQRLRTGLQLPVAVGRVLRLFGKVKPGAVFSMGGFVAGPVMAAAVLAGTPLVIMEPNAIPGAANRYVARWVSRALVSFEETRRWFPPQKTEITGLPVRDEFFHLPRRPLGDTLNILITGGSQGSRTLNRAAEQSWPLFHASGRKVRIVHQTGGEAYAEIQRRFEASGLEGEVLPFIQDMPAAFAAADVIVCRSGAGAVAEIAAAGKAAVLVPFPFAADQHQLKNAEAMARAGAARMVPDAELDGSRLVSEVTSIDVESTGKRALAFARPGAAARAAEILQSFG